MDSNHRLGYSSSPPKQLDQPVRCYQVWVADESFLRTELRWDYLATVMNLFSRRIIVWCVTSLNERL